MKVSRSFRFSKSLSHHLFHINLGKISINKNISPKRQIGFPLIFPSTQLKHLIANKENIMDGLNDHGCICIKNVDFNEEQMIQFTKEIWDEIIELPKFLCFNNQDEKYKQVARVGNVQLDGTLKDSQKQAAYWHQDGNFWGEDKKHIFNCLHTRQEPEQGGNTHVMDLVRGAEFLKTQKPKIFEHIQKLIGLLNVEDINDFKLYNAKNTMGIESLTKHKLIKNNGRKGEDVLFLSVHKLVNPKNDEPSDLKISEVQQILEKQMGFYPHKWQKGDLLIWDNLQVMHRSSGSFKGRRLLFRTQGRKNQ